MESHTSKQEHEATQVLNNFIDQQFPHDQVPDEVSYDEDSSDDLDSLSYDEQTSAIHDYSDEEAVDNSETPFLDSFALFPELPMDLQIMVWRWTLRPRVIELYFSEARGFRSHTPNPVALGVCKESRRAVIKSYPACFGSFVNKRSTLFNFSIDTLFINKDLAAHLLVLFSGLKLEEVSKLKYLAVATPLKPKYGGDDIRSGYGIPINFILKKAAPSMISLREIRVVTALDTRFDLPEASRLMCFYRKLPKAISQAVEDSELRYKCYCIGCGPRSAILPKPPNSLCRIEFPNRVEVTCVWGSQQA